MSENSSAPPNLAGRWGQLWLGVLCMALIANLQYGWTLFVDPMHVAKGWSLAEIQWAFSIFIATETWLTPAAGSHGRSPWSAHRPRPGHRRGRPAGRSRLGGQRLRRLAGAAVYRGRRVGHRGGRDLRHLRRQRGEMVPRSSRSRRRPDRRRLRRGCSADSDPDPPDHRRRRLCCDRRSCGSALARRWCCSLVSRILRGPDRPIELANKGQPGSFSRASAVQPAGRCCVPPSSGCCT